MVGGHLRCNTVGSQQRKQTTMVVTTLHNQLIVSNC